MLKDIIYKKAIILAVVLVISVVFWALVKNWSMRPDISFLSYGTWIPLLGVLIVFASVLSIAYALLDSLYFRSSALALGVLPFIFVFGMTKLNAVTLIIILGMQVFAMRAIHTEFGARLTINIRSIAGAGIRFILSSLLIAIAVAFYAGSYIQKQEDLHQLPPRVQQAIQQAIKVVIAPEVKKLPPEQRAQVESEYTAMAVEQINRILKPLLQYVPEALAIGLFLILQGVNFVFVTFALWVVMGIFVLLRIIRFVRIEERDVKAEHLVL